MVRKLTLRVAYAVQRVLWKVLRPRTRGVKIMLFDRQKRLLLIRNSYGRTDLYVLPGGGIGFFETPERAARREAMEELGLDVTSLIPRSQHASQSEGKRDTVYLFEGQVSGKPRPDNKEVAEAMFVDPMAPHPKTSAATLRRIEEYLGKRQPDGTW